MNILQLILATVNNLAIIVNNPALGGGSSLRVQEISEMLNIFGELLARGEEGYDDLKEFALLVESMAREGREPTITEWATLRARDAAADAMIDEAVERAQAKDDGLDDLSDEELLEILNTELSEEQREEADPLETREDAIALIRATREKAAEDTE